MENFERLRINPLTKFNRDENKIDSNLKNSDSDKSVASSLSATDSLNQLKDAVEKLVSLSNNDSNFHSKTDKEVLQEIKTNINNLASSGNNVTESNNYEVET